LKEFIELGIIGRIVKKRIKGAMMDNSHKHDQDETMRKTEKGHSKHDMQKHEPVSDHEGHGEHESQKANVDHSGHEEMFRRKFWISLLISIPVLIFSPTISIF